MSELFATVLGISLTTGALAALLMLLSPLTGRRYAAKWRFWIWAVLALRLLIPINLIPERSPAPVEKAPVVQAEPVQRPTTVYPRFEFTIPENLTEPIDFPERAPQSEKQTVNKLPKVTPLGVITIVWAAGALICFAAQTVGFLILRRRVIKHGTALTDGGKARAFGLICDEMGIKRRPRLILCEKASPMIIGFLKPRLVLPDSEYSEEQLGFILRHELIHYRRKDVWFKLLFVLAVSVHWFNPVIWIMRRRADIDMELSVDEDVVGQSGYDVRRAYSEALLETLGNSGKVPNMLSTSFCRGKKVMKKRFYNILKAFNRKNGAVLLAAVITLTVALGTMVGCTVGERENISDPLEKANEIIEALRNSGDFELANEILVFDVGSEFGDGAREHQDIELEMPDGSMAAFHPMRSPYDTKKSCMEALHKVFTNEACEKREHYFEESDICRVLDGGTLYYAPSEPVRYRFIVPFESAEKVSDKEIVAKTSFIRQDGSLSDCEITFKKENGTWKIDRILDPEAQRDDPECICAWAVTSEEAELSETDYSAEAEKLMSKRRETVGEANVFAFETNDFDGDGRAEAFCATGEDFDITLWFVTENGAEQILKDEYLVYDAPHLLDFGTDKFYTIELSFGTVSFSHIYGVKDGKWYEHEFSGKVSSITQTGTNSLTGVDEGGYDAFCDENGNDAGGHTYKTYYFYYEGGFKEYGGIEISDYDFLKLDGAREILDMIDESGVSIKNILYRGGVGIITINCYEFDPEDGWTENTYLTVAVDGNSASLVENELNDGVMAPAMISEIATYPEGFKPASDVIVPADT